MTQARPPRAMSPRAATPRVHAHLPDTRRRRYTPDLMADGRRRYEQTPEPVEAIAFDFGCHKATLQRLANREGWVRFAPPPHDLSPAAKLMRAAERLAEGGRVGVPGALEATPTLTLPLSGGGDAEAVPQALPSPGGGGSASDSEPGWGDGALPQPPSDIQGPQRLTPPRRPRLAARRGDPPPPGEGGGRASGGARRFPSP